MALEPDELKRITDLGAEIASLRVDLDKMKTVGAPEGDLKKFGAELESLKTALSKLTPTPIPAPVATTDPEWYAWMKQFVPTL